MRPLKIMDTDLFALLREQSKKKGIWLSMPIQVKGSSLKKKGWDVWISKTPMAEFKGVYILLREYELGKYIFLLLTGDEMREKKEEGKFHLVWDKKRKAERWRAYINTDLGEWKDHEDRWELVKDIERAQSIRVDHIYKEDT